MTRRVALVAQIGAVALGGGLLLGAIGASDSAVPSAELRSRMNGQFVLAESPSTVDQRLVRALERTLGSTGRLPASAQSRLSQAIRYCRGYDLMLTDSAVQIHCDGRPELEEPLVLAGPATVSRVELSDDSLEIASMSGDGRRTVFRFDPQGRLEVDVELDSEQLGQALAWSVRYRRLAPLEPAPEPVSVAER